MSIATIWCRNKDDVVGINNDLPWKIPSDLKRFRRLTNGKTLILGRKTYESLPNRTLPNRKLLVITSNKNYLLSDENNHFIYSNDGIDINENIFVIGGGSIYTKFIEEHKAKYILDFVCNEEVVFGDGDSITKINNAMKMVNRDYNLLETISLEDNITLNIRILKNSEVDDFYSEIKEKL